jgi:hypothetical protein
MGYIRYVCRVLRMAWAESLDQAQAVLFLFVIVLGAAFAEFPTSASLKSMIDKLLTWEGAVWILGAVVLARVAVAPYRIWQADQQKIRSLEGAVAAFASAAPEIFFDHTDPACFRREIRRGSDLPVGWYSVGIRNLSGGTTLDEVTVVADDVPYARALHDAIHLRSGPTFPILFGPAPLYPRSAEYFLLVGLSENLSDYTYRDPLQGGTGQFPEVITVRVRSRATPETKHRFLIDPRSVPALRLLAPSEIAQIEARQAQHRETR